MALHAYFCVTLHDKSPQGTTETRKIHAWPEILFLYFAIISFDDSIDSSISLEVAMPSQEVRMDSDRCTPECKQIQKSLLHVDLLLVAYYKSLVSARG